jgi:hypothetical protein
MGIGVFTGFGFTYSADFKGGGEKVKSCHSLPAAASTDQNLHPRLKFGTLRPGEAIPWLKFKINWPESGMIGRGRSSLRRFPERPLEFDRGWFA